jgi:hypothetical protein
VSLGRELSITDAMDFYEAIGILPDISAIEPDWESIRQQQLLNQYRLERGFETRSSRSERELLARLIHEAQIPGPVHGIGYWFKWSEVKKQKLVFLNSFIVGCASTSSVPIGVLTGMIATVATNLAKLSEEEIELCGLFTRLAPDGKYTQWFTRDELIDQMPDDELAARKRLAVS